MSQAPASMTPSTLAVIVMQARALNDQRHVTGALVYGQQQFMQLLEGEEAVVSALYARIAQDPRHYNVFQLADKAIAARSFAQWSMAFEEVAADPFKALAGYASPEQLAQQLAAGSAVDGPLLERMKDLLRA